MQTVTVVAREAFPYDGIPRRVGESFEATPEDARLLTLIGKTTAPSRAIPIDDSHEHDTAAALDPSTPSVRPTRRYRKLAIDLTTE